MKVKELIEKLKKANPNHLIELDYDGVWDTPEYVDFEKNSVRIY